MMQKITQRLAKTTCALLEVCMNGSDVTEMNKVMLYGGEEHARIMEVAATEEKCLIYHRRSHDSITISMNVFSKDAGDQVEASIVFHKTEGNIYAYVKISDKLIPFKSASLKALKRMLRITCQLEPGDGVINVQNIEVDTEYITSSESTFVLEEEDASTT